MDIREYLDKKRLITDGSFGTYYDEEYHTTEIPELANLTYPERVLEIHKRYIDAGAKLIRTNTFSSNTYTFSSMDEVKKNIQAAIAIAKDAVKGQDVFIAGDIGPIEYQSGNRQDMEEEYFEIAKIFLDNGIDIINFETFSESESIVNIKKKIKEYAENVFIISQFCMNQFGYSNLTFSAKKLIADVAHTEEIDCIGLNCGVGPLHMKKIIKQIGTGFEKYLIALPNSGYPKKVRNHIVFDKNADYFAQNMREIADMGVDAVGGCCGTTPEFIRKLAENIDLGKKNDNKIPVAYTGEKDIFYQTGFYYNPSGEQKKEKLIAVELAPPLNANDEKLLQAAKYLKNAGVDVATFPDSPSGRTRVDSILMAEKVQKTTGLTVMPHICCRDKNAIAMRSEFLGAHINDINNMLIITGDPVPSVARQSVKSVFNFESVGLMNIVKEMNQELFADRPITYGGAINQGRKLEVELGRMEKKMKAGATFFMSQPVFSEKDINHLRIIKERTGARILCGIMPLISLRNATFMKNEIAGVDVTDEILSRFTENMTKEEGEATGIQIAKEMISYTRDFCDGYYFSFPFNRVTMLEQLKDCL